MTNSKAPEGINNQIDGIFAPQKPIGFNSETIEIDFTEMRQQEYAIGIDIGGTNTVFGVVDHRGDISYRGAISTRKHREIGPYIEDLAHTLAPAIDQAGGLQAIRGIGIGAPNGN